MYVFWSGEKEKGNRNVKSKNRIEEMATSKWKEKNIRNTEML